MMLGIVSGSTIIDDTFGHPASSTPSILIDEFDKVVENSSTPPSVQNCKFIFNISKVYLNI